jgi:PAS domain S-box-containing protein
MIEAVQSGRNVQEDNDNLLRLLFESTLDGVLQVCADGRILAANPAACAMLDRSGPDIGSLAGDGLVDAMDPRLAMLHRQCLDFGHARGRLTFLRQDGSRFEADVTSSAYTAAGGERRTCLVIREAADRRQEPARPAETHAELESQVRRLAAQLDAAVREHETFTYSVSHDLRAPLRAVDGFARILRESFADVLPPKGLHYVQRIEAGSRRMGHLLDGLLDLSRVGNQELRPRPCDTARTAREALEDLAIAFPGRIGEVRLGPLPACVADAVLLRHVWSNLLGNALKFSARQETPLIDVGCDTTMGGRVFFVRDNGVGFDMASAGRLFGVCQRLHSASEFEGAGLGLAAASRIIDRHGGRIWAASSAGGGATFFFTLEHGEAKPGDAGAGP